MAFQRSIFRCWSNILQFIREFILTTVSRPTSSALLAAESLHMSRSNKSRIYGCCISRGTCSCLVSWCAEMLGNVGCKSTCFGDEIQRGGFHKRRRISWLAESMSTSQEQVHSEVLVWYLQCFWNCSNIQTESNKNWRQKVSRIAQNSCRSALNAGFLKLK